MMRRRGGLVRMAATTAVVAGTAGAVSHHQQQKYAAQSEQAAAAQAPPPPPPAEAPPAEAPPAAPGGDMDDVIAQLQKLGELKEQGILTEEDVAMAGDALENESSAAMLLFENVWAARFATAVRNANGELVAFERIPREVVVAALDAASA